MSPAAVLRLGCRCVRCAKEDLRRLVLDAYRVRAGLVVQRFEERGG